MSSRLRVFISVVVCLGTASAWAGDGDVAGPQKGQFYINPMFVYYDAPDKLGYDNAGTGPGIALGWSFLQNWAFEGEYDTQQPDLKNPPGGSGQIDNWAANVLYMIPGPRWFTPFTTIGGGKGKYDRDSYGNGKSDTQNQYNFGLGAFFGTSKRVALRADIRGLYTLDSEKLKPWAAVGVVFKLGGQKEAPAPVAAPPVDSDGDGVPDTSDACPNTPAGVQVDSRGCPLDSDGDGVPDYLDKCPDTPRGAKVDAQGCPIPVAPTTFDLTVEFAFNSAEINDLSFGELRKAMTFMREHPDTKALVEGNTDSVGGEAYNQKLSERRAEAVKDVLVKSGIDGDRVSTVGNGESKPIAPNDTEEGRAKNRRVSIDVSDK